MLTLTFVRKFTLLAVLAGSFAGPASAHMYTRFPVYDRGGLYEKSRTLEWPYYGDAVDGAFGPVRFNVSHACGHDEYSPVTNKQVVIVIPTGKTVQKVDTVISQPWEFPKFDDPPYLELGPASPDADGYDWAILYVKPYTQASLNRVYPILGKTSKGETIPRALVWVGDHPNVNDADLEVTTWFPEIPERSCVKEVQYFFPAAQFCGNTDPADSVMGWLLGTTEQWSKDLLGETDVQWAPTVSLMRDLKKKPLPRRCHGKGEVIGIYPSREDIDQYLKPVSVDENGVATPESIEW